MTRKKIMTITNDYLLDDVKNNILSPQVFSTLKNMLQNIWHYSDNHASRVFLLVQHNNDNNFSLDILCELMGGIYEIHELNNASTNHIFDTSEERQSYLYQLLAEELAVSLLPLLSQNMGVLPSQIWASWGLEKNTVGLNFGYHTTTKNIQEEISQWKNVLINPENDIDFMKVEL